MTIDDKKLLRIEILLSWKLCPKILYNSELAYSRDKSEKIGGRHQYTFDGANIKTKTFETVLP